MLHISSKSPLQKKLTTTFLAAVGTLFGVALVFILISFRAYEDRLCREFLETLEYASVDIESSLKEVEDLSLDMVTDITIQRLFDRLFESESVYEREVASHTLRQTLVSSLPSITEAGVNYILMISADGTSFREGVALEPLELDELSYVADKAVSAVDEDDRSAWIFPGEKLQHLTFARAIRPFFSSEPQNVAVLAFFVSPEELLQQALGVDLHEKMDFYIVNEAGHLIYGTNESESSNQNVLLNSVSHQDSPTGYLVQNVDGGPVLISFTVSSNYGWRYIEVVPYSEITSNTLPILRTILCTFAGTFLLIAILVVLQIKSVVLPIDQVAADLQKAGNEILSQGIPTIARPENQKNISALERDFYRLLDKINYLITSNYQKEIALKEWELRALRAQVNPHFLYNTLNTIYWLAASNQQGQIADMVEALSTILHGSISQANFTTIQKECSVLESYVTIQKVRYQNRLQFSLEIDPGLNDCLVPCMILQPLTENSINHVLEEKQRLCIVRVYSILQDDYFEIIHTDNGCSDFIQDYNNGTLVSKGTGIGLKNIDGRIRKLCGDEFGIRLMPLEPGPGTKIIIRIPYGYEESDFGAN